MAMTTTRPVGTHTLQKPAESGFPTISPTFIDDHLGIADRVIGNWKKTVRRAILEDKIDDLYVARKEYEGIVRDWQSQLDVFIQLLVDANHPNFSDDAITVLGRAQRQRRTLGDFIDRIFSRWNSVEEFDALLVEETAIAPDRFDELAKRFSPPASWLEETDDPFAPEASEWPA